MRRRKKYIFLFAAILLLFYFIIRSFLFMIYETPKSGRIRYHKPIAAVRHFRTTVKSSIPGIQQEKDAIPFNVIIKKAVSEGYWRKYAGDFNFAGWFITASYFLIFLLCFLFLKKLIKIPGKRSYLRFWVFLTACVFLLGVNKQLDIQMFIADIGRTYSMAHGWYGTRKYFQIEFIAVSATIGFGIFLVICNALKKIWQSVLLPVAGLWILFSFVIIKASSLHSLEHYFSKRIGDFNLFGIGELTGLFCIGLSAIIANKNFAVKYSKRKG